MIRRGAKAKVKLPNLDAELKGLNKIPPPEFSLFPMHSLVTFVGRRNSGKTYSAIQLALMMKRENAINRMFIISPTFKENRFLSLLEPDEKDVYTHIEGDQAFAALSDIEQKLEEAAAEWEKELKYDVIYQKWKGNKTALTPREQDLMEQEAYRNPDPEGKRPKCALFLDDCSHSALFTTGRQNPLVNMSLRHRHLSGVGLTIFYALQNFKALTRALRLNTCQFALFKTQDKTELDALYEEVAGVVSKENFLRYFEEGTREPHDFLWVDLNQTDDRKIFRKGFDTPLYIRDVERERHLEAADGQA